MKEHFKKGFPGSGLVKVTLTQKANLSSTSKGTHVLTLAAPARDPTLKADLKAKHVHSFADAPKGKPSNLTLQGGLHYDGKVPKGATKTPRPTYSAGVTYAHAPSGVVIGVSREAKSGQETHGLKVDAKASRELGVGLELAEALMVSIKSLPFTAGDSDPSKLGAKLTSTLKAKSPDANGNLCVKAEVGSKSSLRIAGDAVVGLFARPNSEARQWVSAKSHRMVLGVAGHVDLQRGKDNAVAPVVSGHKIEVTTGWIGPAVEQFVYTTVSNGDMSDVGWRGKVKVGSDLVLFGQLSLSPLFASEKKKGGSNKPKPKPKAKAKGKDNAETAEGDAPKRHEGKHGGSKHKPSFNAFPKAVVEAGLSYRISKDAKVNVKVDGMARAAVAVSAKIGANVSFSSIANVNLSKPGKGVTLGVGLAWGLPSFTL